MTPSPQPTRFLQSTRDLLPTSGFGLPPELVFDAETPMDVIKHARDVPVPPSERYELDIPGALDDVVLACLQKSPAERPQSARELSDRLAEVELERPWSEERMTKWWSMHLPGASAASTQV